MLINRVKRDSIWELGAYPCAVLGYSLLNIIRRIAGDESGHDQVLVVGYF